LPIRDIRQDTTTVTTATAASFPRFLDDNERRHSYAANVATGMESLLA
jgi:hypothetical protein